MDEHSPRPVATASAPSAARRGETAGKPAARPHRGGRDERRV